MKAWKYADRVEKFKFVNDINNKKLLTGDSFRRAKRELTKVGSLFYIMEVQMKSIKAELDRNLDNLVLRVFSDWHIGAPNCNYSIITQQIKKVKEDDKTYCLINGDLIDNSSKSSVGDVYGQTMSPMEQIKKVVELLKPIKHKILGITSGNHEERAYRQDGIDLSYFLAQSLGLEDKYDQVSILLYLRFGKDKKKESNNSGEYRKICYKIYMTHGCGGGATIGAKANALERTSNAVSDCDIYISAHTHAPMTFPELRNNTDERNSSYCQSDVVYLCSGSTLDYSGSYAEQMKLKPASMRQPRLLLDGTMKFAEGVC